MELNTILQILTVTVIAIIGFFLKDKSKKLDDADKENGCKIETLKKESDLKIESIKKELTDFKTEMPFHYVLRDDFIRAMTAFDSKLDKIYDKISQKGSDC